jgi:hypothetical protein
MFENVSKNLLGMKNRGRWDGPWILLYMDPGFSSIYILSLWGQMANTKKKRRQKDRESGCREIFILAGKIVR